MNILSDIFISKMQNLILRSMEHMLAFFDQ